MFIWHTAAFIKAIWIGLSIALGWLANPVHFNDGNYPDGTDYSNLITDAQGTWGGNVDGSGYGLSNSAYVVLVPGGLPGTTYTVSAASWASGVATFTVGAWPTFAGVANSPAIGQLVTISGASPSGWNAIQVAVTATTSTTLSIAMTGNPGTWSSGGTVQVGGVPAANGMVALYNNGELYTYYSGTWVLGVGTVTALGAVTSVNGITTTGQGVSSIVATLGLTGQTANISTTNLIASAPANGMYRVTVYETISTAASSSSTLPSVTIGYTDKDSSTAISGVAAEKSTANVLGTVIRGEVICHLAVGTAITYSTTNYASSGGTALAYALHLRVEFLG